MRGNVVKASQRQLLYTLLLASGVSVSLFIIRAVGSDSLRFYFLLWNLLLAWVPLALVLFLREQLNHRPWSSWQNIVLSILWLIFLPNSFYIISDLVHLQSSGEASLLYDVALLMSFVLNGLLLGYCSLYVMHQLLFKRFGARLAHILIALILLSCSFAIYLGRFLRWNSWDVFLSPAGLLFDISERLINPLTYSQTFVVTGVFFILLGSVYMVIYQFIRIIAKNHKAIT